mmetsp:Transcript_38916/g.122583  ORF Transcript_38916/g.122583 Transcript_38916/m.122583 type:complete len:256 (+) Transcript_38916:143-910(+)
MPATTDQLLVFSDASESENDGWEPPAARKKPEPARKSALAGKSAIAKSAKTSGVRRPQRRVAVAASASSDEEDSASQDSVASDGGVDAAFQAFMRKFESQQKKEVEKARRKADAEFEAIRAAKYEEANADIRELKDEFAAKASRVRSVLKQCQKEMERANELEEKSIREYRKQAAQLLKEFEGHLRAMLERKESVANLLNTVRTNHKKKVEATVKTTTETITAARKLRLDDRLAPVRSVLANVVKGLNQDLAKLS